MHAYVRDSKPGAVIVGSHVKKTTRQLAMLLEQPGIVPLEVDVDRIAAAARRAADRNPDAGRATRMPRAGRR